ncbi:hypothetical protein [Acinetobacter modestus]|uniref:hypothetical protein n=1 Tax=Acinetobacter modestus TaxID=1776740 RepID=UPI003016D716
MPEQTELKSPFSVIRQTALTLIERDIFVIQQYKYIELVQRPINWLYGSVNAYYISEIITDEERQKVLSFLEYYSQSFRPIQESTSHVSHVADYLAFVTKENCTSEITKIKESSRAKSRI